MSAEQKGGTAPFFCVASPGVRCLGSFLLILSAGHGWAAQSDVGITPDAAEARAAATEDGEEDVALPAQQPVPPSAPAPGLVGASRGGAQGPVDDQSQAEWGIPPIPWRSQLNLSSAWSRSGEGASSGTFARQLSTQASSYLWQPWFARVNASATFAESDSRSDSGKSVGSGVGADFGLNLLPASRFPLNMGYSQYTNRAEGGISTSSVTSRRFSMDQRYVPEEGGYTANWTYGLNELETGAGERSVGNNLSGSLGIPMPGDNPQSVSLAASLSNQRVTNGGASDFASVSGVHSIYLEDYVMNINSDALVSANRHSAADGLSESNVAQMGSAFDWIPDDDSPLRLAGSLRGFNTRALASREGSADSNRFSTLNGQLSASYPLSQQWTFSGAVNGLGTWIRNAGGQSVSVAQVVANGTASWRGDGWRTKLQEWDYSLSYGSMSQLSRTERRASDGNDESSSVLGVSASLGQALERRFAFEGYKAPLRLQLSQNYSAANAAPTGLVQTLGHTANGVWQLDASAKTQVNLSASVSDTRAFGRETTTNYQSAQLSLSGNTLLGAYSSLSSNLGVQLNRQQTRSEQASGGGDWLGSATGGLGYSHSRFAEVSGLTYSARYFVSVRPSERTNLTETAKKQFQADHQVTQGWAWRLGLLGWRLDNTFSYDAYGRTTASLLLSVTRDFAGVL
jgi:hypothetical protein